MTANDVVTPSQFNTQSVGIATAGVLVGGVAAILCAAFEVPPGVSAGVASIAGVVPLSVGYVRWRMKRGVQREITALAHGQLERPIAIVLVLLAFVLLFVESLIGFIIGSTLDIAWLWSNATSADVAGAMGQASLFFSVPLFILAAFFLLERASHYLGRHPVKWLVVALVLFYLLRTAIVLIVNGVGWLQNFPDVSSILLNEAVLVLVLIPVAWLASLLARSRHPGVLAARLLRKLGPADKAAVLELLGAEVETVATAHPAAST